MDIVQRSFYTMRFQLAFHTKKGTEFQDWFVLVAGHALGSDFEEVRPYGNKGDLKCDGRQVSTGTIFQSYAPYLNKENELVEKIETDCAGAVAEWPTWMKHWVLVHNDSRGLPPGAIVALDGLRQKFPGLKIEVWSEPELLSLSSKMSLEAHIHVYGFAPSMKVVENLALADLVPVLDTLERSEPSAVDPPLTPPSVKKLEKNGLSAEAGILLQMGRRKSDLVGLYFRRGARPDLGERIAQAFRERYALLKALDLPADGIFWNFQEYAGSNGDPQRQGAALAVITYFFDACDIFEDPDDLGTSAE